VKVTSVHPGGIKTAIARNGLTAEGVNAEAQSTFFDKRLASTTPRRAAEIILDGVRKNKPRVLVGQDAVVLDAIVRITGAGYQRLFSPVVGRIKPPSR
jgi:short-subunit dehydrogenase